MNELIKQIIDAYWDGFIPVDIVAIIQKTGISIDSFTNNTVQGIYRNSNGIKSITYNGSKTLLCQRYILAHGFAHHLLGQVNHLRYATSDSYSGNNVDHDEVRANQFATEILIPTIAIEYMIKREGIADIPELATAFQVSEQAMYYRLLNLGYIK